MIPHICTLSGPQVTSFIRLHFTAMCFRVTGHFETSVLNNLKMTLNTMMSQDSTL